MNTAAPAIHDLARRLIAREAARDPVGAAGRACDQLRGPLAKLVGVAGFRSLLARALALATAEVPWLSAVSVRDDGSLQGFDAAKAPDQAGEAGAVVVARLVGLLMTFIGANLTWQLVRDAWPDDTDPTTGGHP